MEESKFSDYLNSLQERKNTLLNLANKASENGWIPKSKSEGKNVISLEEIKEKLGKDTLTIGVIGQMKCGKSTFLNSFIFEEDVLPAATTPMTAALSVITYGESKRIVAEFYTVDEWAEQKQQAARSLDDASGNLDESKIKAAKELVEKSAKLGSSLNSLLGKTQEDTFDNLIEYVGADGKYISITKSVTIYYPEDYLKGVEIVDTPGFNDPIVSREERTKEFLKKADVVLMLLYAGRPFDATDRDIIFKNVRQCGIGKVLIGINKYDIPYCSDTNPEDENQIKDYVKAEIRKACRDCNDDTLVEILREAEPIPLSAEMALLSELPMNKITNSDTFDFSWKRHCSNFGIGTQKEMRQWSHIDNLIEAVKKLVDNEKSNILFLKPLNAICAAGDKVKTEIENELNLVNSKIELLMMPDTEVEEKEENLNKANRRLTKKINCLGEDLDAEMYQIVRKGKNELEDAVDASCQRMRSIVDNEWGRFSNISTIIPRLDAELQNLITRKLKRSTQNLAEEGRKKVKRNMADFFADAQDLLMRYLPEFDSRDYLKSAQNKIQMDIDGGDLFSYDSSSDSNDDTGLLEMFGDAVNAFMTGATFGVWGGVMNALTHGDVKQEVHVFINSISSDFNPDPYLHNAFHSKDDVIDFVKRSFITDLINPLQEQIQEIRSKRDQKDKDLSDAQVKRDDLENKKKIIMNQIEEFSSIKSSIL